MKLLVQRVTRGSVTLNKGTPEEEVIGSIGKGYVILLGISRNDYPEDVDYLVGRLCTMRMLPNAEGKEWALSLQDAQADVLIVSQFTLYGYLNGSKPDFHEAMGSGAEDLYNRFVTLTRQKLGDTHVQTGKFGTYMSVLIENDGPATLIIDSRISKYVEGADGMSRIGGSKTFRKYQKEDNTPESK
ncbi:D-tyrosyl-tRNA(Tyr) deacylase [Giardia muris]|uniref:D-aminoacyl-tRNA deacylase n=1 Tax=Giardia muris TaxID=5742 RepID=A0A4Z1SXM2_GIAMU|nr:D-tyrosyl-tRNA(Tyr) deacylase [Giardia muris]|eukprot:TNJ30446.1 D-tyrosyl-tRNA(Tyr) deacylase [Giardia muris]